jgi:class 3 adenylate cyclase
VRVADADRDRTVALLREHVVAGRLTLDEFSDRVGRALGATTRADLEAVMTDLPSAQVPAPETGVEPLTPRKRRRWHIAVMSGHDTKGRWRISGQTNAIAVMGGCDLDLRYAEIEGPEVVITAFAFWGGIKVIVPEGFDVELTGFSFMGGRSLKTRDVPLLPGSPRITVRGFAVMGGIDVRSRPNRSNRSGRSGGSGRSGRRNRTLSEPAAAGADELVVGPGSASPGEPAPASAPPAPPVHVPGPPRPPSPPPPPPPPRSQPLAPDEADLQAVHDDIATDGTVTILFCDMVDYAGMTERLGDRASHRLLGEHHRMVRQALAHHGGREIKVQGDGFMIAFGGVARALRCAMEIQRTVDAYEPDADGEPIAVHIGINTGDALVEADDFLGHAVIVASRLADAAAPGEILVSSLSEQLVQGSGEFTFSGHRETRLKGMARAQLSATLSWTDQS